MTDKTAVPQDVAAAEIRFVAIAHQGFALQSLVLKLTEEQKLLKGLPRK